MENDDITWLIIFILSLIITPSSTLLISVIIFLIAFFDIEI
jgi:hypothetical protein